MHVCIELYCIGPYINHILSGVMYSPYQYTFVHKAIYVCVHVVNLLDIVGYGVVLSSGLELRLAGTSVVSRCAGVLLSSSPINE